MEVTVKKLCKPVIVYKIAPSGNSKLAGRKIVSVASVAKCWRLKTLSRGFVLSQSIYFLSSLLMLINLLSLLLRVAKIQIILHFYL